VSNRIFEGQTGIQNRTCSSAGSLHLPGLGAGGGIGPVLVRIVLRFGGLWYTTLGHDGKALSVSGDAVSVWCAVRQFEELLESLPWVVLCEKIGSEGSFVGRPFGATVISNTVQLFADEMFGIFTVSDS